MRFFVPTDLCVGTDCVRAAGDALRLRGESCLVVTGQTAARKSGALGDLYDALDAKGVRHDLYDGVTQNPTVACCMEAGRLAACQGAKFVIGVGGGSALDAAKAVSVFASNPALTEAELYGYVWPNDPLPVVCVGTTAGTGSEVTPVAVLTNAAGRKQSIRDDRLYPVLSLGDARYTYSLPNALTCSCAADAAAHCIESFFSKQATEMSRMFASHGASMLAPIFHRICTGGVASLTDHERAELYLASLYGGYAISMTGTAFPHAMGYFLTEAYGVPHGVACAVYLPAFLLHAYACDKVRAKAFCAQTGCSGEEWLSLLRGVTPACDVRLTTDEVEALRARFTNNRGLIRSPGNFTPDDALRVIGELFIPAE